MHFCQRRWDYKCYKCAGFRYGKGESMGKFAVKIERVITIALILSVMLILIPGVSVQAKAGCNHKHTGRTWIIAEKANCNHTGRKKQLCVRCRKVLLEKVIPKTKHKWKLTRKRRTRYDCLKCGGVKLKNEYGGWSYYFP